MSKKATERALAANEAKAVIRHIRISPRKLNLVAGLIRGMNVGSALTQLAFSSKRIAVDVRKALQSAIANAENNHNLNVDSLIVKEAYVGKNMVMKRMHTRGRGRSAGILKPFSNLTLIVSEKGEEEVKKPKKVKAKKDAAAAKDKKAPAKAKAAKKESK
jgi:large subunit ribosomal protein L22